MTPPPEQFVIETAPGRLHPTTLRHPRFPDWVQGGLPLLVDVGVLTLLFGLVVAWTSVIDPAAAIFAATVLAMQLRRDGRRAELNLGALSDLPVIARRILFGYALASAVVTLAGTGSALTVLLYAGAAFPALVTGRAAAYTIQRRTARNGHLRRTLVVGTGELAQRLIKSVEDEPDHGLQVIGAVDDRTLVDAGSLGTRVLGSLGDLHRLVTERDVKTVIVAYGNGDDAKLLNELRRVLAQGVDVWVVPRLFEIGQDNIDDQVGSIPLTRLSPPVTDRSGWALKRGMDLVASAVGIIVTFPVLALIALAVKLDSRGPILFKQGRVGLNGSPMQIWKFRTMAPATDLRTETEWCADENRVTRVGRFLRKTGLDELPQLFNVLRGELTLVGPRPERPVFVKIFKEMYPHYDDRHRVPVGITGWSQIHGLRGDSSIDDRAHFDNYYIEKWSLWNDLKILALTPRTFLRKYRGPTCSATAEEAGQRETLDEEKLRELVG